MKTIRISKKIILSSQITDVKQKETYDTILKEIKQQYNANTLPGSNWLRLKELNHEHYLLTINRIRAYCTQLFAENQGFEADIIARHELSIKLNLFYSTIIDYDFKDATIEMYFQSEQFELLETFGHLILVKQNIENSYPFLVDLNDDSLSISEYIKTN